MHLWLPLLSMIQIWKASKNPSDWQLEKTPFILFIWWFLWLATFFIVFFEPYILGKGVLYAKHLLYIHLHLMIEQIIWILTSIILLIVIAKISQYQIKSYE